MMYEIDFTFGLAWQSRVILEMLKEFKDTEPATKGKSISELDIDIRTRPLYNGRERGICLIVTPHEILGESLLIFFAETRGGENAFIQHHVTNTPSNPPTMSNFTTESYQDRTYYKESQLAKAAKDICKLIGKFYTAQDD